MSTFLVECSEKHLFRLGLRHDERGRNPRGSGAHFRADAGRPPLISNRSIWRQFPIIHNERWSVGNKVILGDALHTAHFSIGSGTRLAMEDAIALARAIRAHPRDVQAALAAYEAQRKPILDKLVTAANDSADMVREFRHAHGARRLTNSRCPISRAPAAWISSASAGWRRNSSRNGSGRKKVDAA